MSFYGNIINYLEKTLGSFFLKDANKTISSNQITLEQGDEWINIDGDESASSIILSHGGETGSGIYSPELINDSLSLPVLEFDKGHLKEMSKNNIKLNYQVALSNNNGEYQLFQGGELVSSFSFEDNYISSGEVIEQDGVFYLSLSYQNADMEPLIIALPAFGTDENGVSVDYVNEQDKLVLKESKEYTDNKTLHAKEDEDGVITLYYLGG